MAGVPALLSHRWRGVWPFNKLVTERSKLIPHAFDLSRLFQSPLRLLSNKLLWISELLFLLPQMNLNYNFLGVSRWLQARVKFNEREAAEFML